VARASGMTGSDATRSDVTNGRKRIMLRISEPSAFSG
jgi:hypothetical protein